jgi:hypothetical protein
LKNNSATKAQIQKRLEQDPKFIALSRFDNNIDKFMERYPDGGPQHIVAAALDTTEEDVRQRYDDITEKLKEYISPESV